jgi:hypothetical protein
VQGASTPLLPNVHDPGGSDQCETCRRNVGAGTCAACGRTICDSCRCKHDGLDRLCVDCGAPRRLPSADLRYCIAWALGDRCRLLVGERSAMLVRRDDRLVLVPDADRDDPVRRRLRALAAALRLPPEIGLRWAGPAAAIPAAAIPAAAIPAAAIPAAAIPAAAIPAASDPGAVGPFTVSVETREEVAWSWLADGGSEVDTAASAALPETEGPPVTGESESGLAGLLAGLRAAATPPPVGALVVTPVVEVSTTTVGASGLERRVERRPPGGATERGKVERAPFVPTEHDAEPPARPVAAARLGRVTARLDAVHASFRLTAEGPEGERSWFVPAGPGLTMGSEQTWASVVQAAGLAEGTRVLRAADTGGFQHDGFAEPSEATLVDRKVEQVWRMVRGVPDAGVARADELALVGYQVMPVEQPPAGPAGLLETARRLDPLTAGPQITLAICLQVEEHWAPRRAARTGGDHGGPGADHPGTGADHPGTGADHPGTEGDHGTGGGHTATPDGLRVASRSYLVTPGRKPWPVLDDTGERARDFGVDDLGHLHRAGSGWRCPACQRSRCPACGPEGRLGTCADCGEPACHTCRSEPVPHDEDQQCERCGVASCKACGRTIDARACKLCRRLVCRSCQEAAADSEVGHTWATEAGLGGLCLACAGLRPASVVEIASLPAELAAAGLDVRIAVDGEWTVASLAGRYRRELAVVHAGRIVRWETALGDAPVLLRTRIGAAMTANADVEIRQGKAVAAPAPPDPHLLLDSTRRDSLRWSVLDPDGRPVAGGDEPPTPYGADSSTSVLAGLVEEAGWSEVAIPERADGEVADLLRELPVRQDVIARSAAAMLLLDPRPAVELRWLDADGLHRAAFDGRDASKVDVAWTQGPEPAWAGDGWYPEPRVALACELEGEGAALVRVGTHVVLGMHDGEGTRWYPLRNHPAELAKLLLGGALDEEEPLYEVVELTDPDTIRGPALVDGSLEQRVWAPLVEERQGTPKDRLLQTAIRRFVSFELARPPDEQSEPPPAELVEALLDKVDQIDDPSRRVQVAIGLQVDEHWVAGGSEARLRYELAPGDHEGMVLCEATGAMVTAVSRDREGHLVATTTTCRYCRTETCGLCVAPARPCTVCQILICGRCSSSPEPDYVPRCPACVAMRRLGFIERRRFHGVLVPGGRVLTGQDALHGVTLIEARGGWQLMLAEPGQELPSIMVAAGTPRARLVGRIADMA